MRAMAAVFHFSGGIPFSMNVADFFEHQCAFKGDRKVDTASEVKRVGAVLEVLGDFLNFGRLA